MAAGDTYFMIGPIWNTFTISFLFLISYSIVYAKIPKGYRYFIVSAVFLSKGPEITTFHAA
jgi:hypothetical protein